MKLFVHRAPGNVSSEKKATSERLNSKDSAFKNHFEKEAIVSLDRFLVCYKAMPWMANDLMIIDQSDGFVRSPSELKDEEIIKLRGFINASVRILASSQEIKKIVIGANINPFPGKEDQESIQRLHIHICGFNQSEIEQLEPLDEETPIYNDGIIESFKKTFQNSDYESYVYGVKKELADATNMDLTSEIIKADQEAQLALKSLIGKYECVSYSFAIILEDGEASIYISPKSKDGRGVLEATGIILRRDANLQAGEQFITERNRFLKKVQRELLKFSEAKLGKFKLEEK